MKLQKCEAYMQEQQQQQSSEVRYYSTLEFAHMVGVGTDVARQWAREGRVAASKRGRFFVFTQQQVDDFMKGTPYVPANKPQKAKAQK
jgi:Helix-turn-helix domain